jgi:hypothetical protein
MRLGAEGIPITGIVVVAPIRDDTSKRGKQYV